MNTRATVVPLVATMLSLSWGSPVTTQEPLEPQPLPAVELPVNLQRLKQRLAALPSRDEDRSLLKLNFYVEVYGRAPEINPLEGFDLHSGPVPYGPPSHATMLRQMSPVAYQSGSSGAVLGWSRSR